jgi:glucose-6-phosphate 1-dehydrogenase
VRACIDNARWQGVPFFLRTGKRMGRSLTEALHLQTVAMAHCHHCVCGLNTAQAYEILLHEFLVGDQTLFTRWDFVQASWHWVDAITAARSTHAAAFPDYAAGTSGPAAAAALPGTGREWLVSRDILS